VFGINFISYVIISDEKVYIMIKVLFKLSIFNFGFYFVHNSLVKLLFYYLNVL